MREKNGYYFIGILGLLPMIGLFTGVFLLITGYRLRIMNILVIGVINMLITLIMLAVLVVQTSPNSEFFRDAAIKNSEIRLNELIKSIEVYKINHNEYPDSLSQLKFSNRLFTDMDPLQAEIGSIDRKFKYHKVLDGYYLFSAGVDGIEFTEDDLFPDAEFTLNTGYKNVIKNDTVEGLR